MKLIKLTFIFLLLLPIMALLSLDTTLAGTETELLVVIISIAYGALIFILAKYSTLFDFKSRVERLAEKFMTPELIAFLKSKGVLEKAVRYSEEYSAYSIGKKIEEVRKNRFRYDSIFNLFNFIKAPEDFLFWYDLAIEYEKLKEKRSTKPQTTKKS